MATSPRSKEAWEYMAKKPRDNVGVDTLDIRPQPGVVLKVFTAAESLRLKWEGVDDSVRPSQALGYLTAQEHLDECSETKKEARRR